MFIDIENQGLTHLMELPAVIKDGEVVVPPRPEFIGNEGLVKLKALASSLGGEVIYYKVRATEIKNLEVQTCVSQGCYNRANLLYCDDCDKRAHRHVLRPVPRAN